MSRKEQLNKYIEELEKIQEEFPVVSERIESVISMMQNDYNDAISKEIERQKIRRLQTYDMLKDTEEYRKVDGLALMEFIVVPHDKRATYRGAKCRCSLEHPERRFTMRYVKGVGTLLTRVQ